MILLKVQTKNGLINIETTDKDYLTALQSMDKLNGLYLGTVFIPTDNIVAILAEPVEKNTHENEKREKQREEATKSD